MRDVLDAADGCSVLLITHRPEGLDLVDRVVTLAPGRAARRRGLARVMRRDQPANGVTSWLQTFPAGGGTEVRR